MKNFQKNIIVTAAPVKTSDAKTLTQIGTFAVSNNNAATKQENLDWEFIKKDSTNQKVVFKPTGKTTAIQSLTINFNQQSQQFEIQVRHKPHPLSILQIIEQPDNPHSKYTSALASLGYCLICSLKDQDNYYQKSVAPTDLQDLLNDTLDQSIKINDMFLASKDFILETVGTQLKELNLITTNENTI